MYTTKEAAAVAGLSTQRVRQAIEAFNLGSKVGRDWILTESDIRVLKSRKGKRGRANWVTGE